MIALVYIIGLVFSAVVYDTLFADKEDFTSGKLVLMAAAWPLTLLMILGVGLGVWIKNGCDQAGIEP